MQKLQVQAVVFDLSGTVIDFGSRGPVAAFVELFARQGVSISEKEARRPMGSHKLDHIQTLLADPEIRRRWADRHGAPPDDSTATRLYPEFTELQIEVLEQHSEVLPGVAELTAELGRRGIRYASTTGFDQRMMEGVVKRATAGGFRPEVFVCPDMVGAGRPAPWMAFHAAKHMGLYPMSTFVKVGDTAVDLEEARNAGMWAVSVAVTGNEVGLSAAEWAALKVGEQEAIRAHARERFLSLGAHYVIDSAAELLPVIERINERLAAGDRP